MKKMKAKVPIFELVFLRGRPQSHEMTDGAPSYRFFGYGVR